MMMLAALLTLGPSVRATVPGAAAPQQVWAAADPRDARRLIACGRMDDPADNLDAGYVLASSDSGAAWSRTLLENSTRWVSEESCTYGPDGSAYFIAGASNFYGGAPHHETGRVHFYVSPDGGRLWNRTWTRNDGWLDWTATATAGRSIVIFANQGTNRPGHWLVAQPVAAVSHDGGRTFSKLITLRRHFATRTAVWSGGHVTLKGGTVLFATSTALGEGGMVRVEVYAVDPHTKELTSRAVLRTRHGVPIFTSAITQSDGRLYVAWVEEEKKTSALFLARSVDGGFHWRVQRIFGGGGTIYPAFCRANPPIDDVRLAASGPNVGVAWISNRSTVHFTVSNDGGATFTPPATLADAGTSRLAAFEVLPFDDYWLDATLVTESGHPDPQAQWANTPGISVVMGRSTLRDISLTASRNGIFHAFWIAPSKKSFAVFTRTISVSAGTAPPQAHTRPIAACAREDAAALAAPATPGPLPVIRAAGVPQYVKVEPVRYAYDDATRTVSADVRVLDSRTGTLNRRLRLVGLAPHSDFGAVRVLNADGLIDGHPYWNVPGNKPVHIAARIVNFTNIPSNYLDGDGFAMAIQLVPSPGR